MTQARLRWGNHVNDSGLLDNLEAALAFKAFSDTRVPELAPFYVYEIFKIKAGVRVLTTACLSYDFPRMRQMPVDRSVDAVRQASNTHSVT